MRQGCLLATCFVALLASSAGESSESKPLEAAPACAGEIRLTIADGALPQAKLEVLRTTQALPADTQPPEGAPRNLVIGVTYQALEDNSSPPDAPLYKEYTATAGQTSTVSVLIRQLVPGKRYQLSTRQGSRSGGSTAWGDYSAPVESSSGTVATQPGPAGVGEGSRSYCQSRHRTSGISRPKQQRVHRATFASSSRRRRSCSGYNYNYGYSYYSSCDIALSSGAIVGIIAAVLVVFGGILTFVVCYRGVCGRQPLQHSFRTSMRRYVVGAAPVTAVPVAAMHANSAAPVVAQAVQPVTAYPIAMAPQAAAALPTAADSVIAEKVNINA